MSIATAAPQANEAELEIEVGPHARGELAVLSFEADDGVREPSSAARYASASRSSR